MGWDQKKLQEQIEAMVLGPIRWTSGYRGGPGQAWHGVAGGAQDFVPSLFWLNVILLELLWPGGMGYDPSHVNRHIHLDVGPRLRWRETGYLKK